jgi:hypothetical protein
MKKMRLNTIYLNANTSKTVLTTSTKTTSTIQDRNYKRYAWKRKCPTATHSIALLTVKKLFFQDKFFSSAEARGLISDQIIEQSAKSTETIPIKLKIPSKSWLLSLISAAWTRSLYEIYWKPRTCILFREKHEATNAKKRELLRAQRDSNNAKAKTKKNALPKPKSYTPVNTHTQTRLTYAIPSIRTTKKSH